MSATVKSADEVAREGWDLGRDEREWRSAMVTNDQLDPADMYFMSAECRVCCGVMTLRWLT